ncbi:MAG: TSUP family transporter [Gammaproteobacteria bacterium]|nr:TSUP family transporter [Gammaproteobacteria bacterium]
MSELALGLELLLLLFMTGLCAGALDAVAGGGGLITLPVLLAVGIAPTEALATNKLQGSFGTFSSSLYFVRRGLVNLPRIAPLIALTFIGSAGGTLLVQRIDSAFLTRFMPLLLIATALYFWFGPALRDTSRRERVGALMFGVLVGCGVGFYDGFFGPGAGTFFTFGFVFLLGLNLIEATAHTKVLNFTSNIASLIFFALAGKVIWGVGLTMAAGQLIGGRLGAHLVHSRGTRLVRPAVVVVSLTISLKLLVDAYL